MVSSVYNNAGLGTGLTVPLLSLKIQARQNQRKTTTQTKRDNEKEAKQKQGTTTETNNQLVQFLFHFLHFPFSDSLHRRKAVLYLLRQLIAYFSM